MRTLYLIFCLLFLLNCSKDFIGNSETGGGTETVIGMIIDSADIPIENVIVKLIPKDFDPINQLDSNFIYTDTTDKNGEYSFNNIQPDIYNLFAYTSNQDKSAAIRDIEIDEIRYYSYVNIIQKSGAIKIIMSDTTVISNKSIFIPGTDIIAKVDNAQLIDSSYFCLIIDDIPPSLYSEIQLFDSENDSLRKIYGDVEVMSNDTTIISTQFRWDVINTYNSGLPCNIVFDMVIDNDGRHWYATDAGVATLMNGDWEYFNTYNSGLPSNFIYSIAFSPNGTKWFGTKNGLAKFTNGNWKVYQQFDSDLPDNTIHKIIISKNEDVIVGTHNGAAIFDGDSSWIVFNRLNSDLPHNEVYCIAEESDGTIWFGTDGGGIGVFKSGMWNVFNTGNSSLLSDFIFELKVDNVGRVIIGSNNVIAFVDNGNWDVVTIDHPANTYLTISKITQESDSLFWLGSYSKGNVILYELGKGMTFFNSSNTQMSPYVDMITEIIVDDAGDKWISTCSGGVYKVSLIE